MKTKNYFLFISFAFLSFNIFSQSYKSHKFYSVIIEQGTITEDIALQNCHRTFNSQELSGKYIVNIFIETRLQTHRFYLLDFGRGLNYYYLTSSTNNKNYDEDYTLNSSAGIQQLADCFPDPEPIDPPSLDIRNFKINASLNQTFNYPDRFDYQFEIRGDYTRRTHGHSQIDLIVYYESESSQNEIGRIYWNREDDEQLIFNSYTLNKTWVTSLYTNWQNKNYYTTSGKKFILKAKYGDIIKRYTYIVPEQDSDGDGINDSQDNCPNVYGVAENNGCPGLPNLVKKHIKIYNNNTGNYVYDSTDDDNDGTPLLRRENTYLIEYAIQNTGLGTANTSTLATFFSINSSFDEFYDCEINESDFNISSPGDYDEKEISLNINTFGHVSGCNTQLNSGNTYYLIFQMDFYYDVDESHENNTITLPFKYSSATVSSSRSTPSLSKDIEIFDFSGNKISTQRINSDEEEKAIIENLPKGYYIIKNGDKTTKISK